MKMQCKLDKTGEEVKGQDETPEETDDKTDRIG
jgi:hypothetical protein